MKKSLIALALVSAFTAPAFAEEAAPASNHTFTGNVALTSNYIFRGISQSQNKPAIQGGFDYSHSSGLYAGTWASNVGWITTKDNNSLEWDFYAGYKGTFAGDFSYDVGALKYYYPGNSNGNSLTPDTTELYVAIGWKFITLKYNYSISKYLFAWGDQNSAGGDNRGSGYIDLSANYDLGNGWGVQGHIGHQDIKNYSNASYTDWKLGVTKDLGFGVVGLAYTDTDANGCGTASNAYCWTGKGATAKDVSKAQAVLTFSKSF
jgi:uncharacterized protein (TIGR02001 family)